MPCRSSVAVAVLFVCSCGGSASKEIRELEKLELALGMVASAGPEERPIRLEQLDNLRLESERLRALKELCRSSYASFDNASRLLAQAKERTREVEEEIARASEKKNIEGTLSPEEERRLVEMGKEAAKSLETVTVELDRAQSLVSACEKRRIAARIDILSE